MGTAGAAATDAEPRTAGTERVFTWPLTLFLCAVATILGHALWTRYALPDAAGAIAELADGSLDRRERVRMLRHLVETTARSEDPTELWAGLLAAILVEDRDAHAQRAAALGGGPVPTRAPAGPLVEWLHLGDPVGIHLLDAFAAERSGDHAGARRAWQEVAAASGPYRQPFAGELATAALARLPR